MNAECSACVHCTVLVLYADSEVGVRGERFEFVRVPDAGRAGREAGAADGQRVAARRDLRSRLRRLLDRCAANSTAFLSHYSLSLHFLTLSVRFFTSV